MISFVEYTVPSGQASSSRRKTLRSCSHVRGLRGLSALADGMTAEGRGEGPAESTALLVASCPGAGTGAYPSILHRRDAI